MLDLRFYNAFSMPDQEQFRLDAIWLDRPIQIKSLHKRTCRISKGMEISVDNGKPSDTKLGEQPTHKIMSLFGSIDSRILRLIVVSLNDNTPAILTLTRSN